MAEKSWLRVLIIFSIFLSRLYAQELKIEPDLKTLYVPNSSSQTLTCILNGSPEIVKLNWTLPKFATAYPDRFAHKAQNYRVNQDGTYSIKKKLTLVNYGNELDGAYKCSYSTGNMEKKAIIDVQEIQAFISNNTYNSGDKSVSLVCEIHKMFGQDANLTYLWRKNGVDLQDGEKYSVDKNNRTLTINNLGLDDAGRYSLMYMRLDEGNDPIVACPVDYKGHPEISAIVKTMKSKQEAQFDCLVTGWPIDEVSWYNGDDKVNASRRITFEPYGAYDDARMIIRHFQPEDEANLACKAYSATFKETAAMTAGGVAQAGSLALVVVAAVISIFI